MWSCPTSDKTTVLAIGHSTRTIPEFVSILRSAGVERVVDVRSVPRSRTNPQYNFEILGDQLAQFGIAYGQIASLGGLRGRSRSVPPEVNAFWKNQSFHNYADYALSDGFEEGFDELATVAALCPSTIMCAEGLWWRCHRRIVADYLLMRGWPVIHLMGEGRPQRATITAAARERDGKLVYPVSALLKT